MKNNLVKNFIKEIKLFFKAPKEYFWIYTYSNNEKVKIGNFDPVVKKQGYKLIDEIQKKIPNLRIHFLGSAELEIPGERDIDLFVECIPEKFEEIIPKLTEIIGTPIKRRKRFVEWAFKRNSTKVELLLVDPNWKKFQNKLLNFEKLKKHKEAYAAIKLKSQGKSMREYERKKFEYFYGELNFN